MQSSFKMSSSVSVVFALAGVAAVFLDHQNDHENGAQEPDSSPESQNPSWKRKTYTKTYVKYLWSTS